MLSAQINLGNALKGEQKYAESDQVLRKALEQSPSSPDALFNLGILYLDGTLPDVAPVQRLEAALAFFQRYKQSGAARGSDDPVEAYIQEATKKLEVERKRAEQQRAQPKAPPAVEDDGDEGGSQEAEPSGGDADEAPADEAAEPVTPPPAENDATEAGDTSADGPGVMDPGTGEPGVGEAGDAAPAEEK